jgi:hypothetical protein
MIRKYVKLYLLNCTRDRRDVERRKIKELMLIVTSDPNDSEGLFINSRITYGEYLWNRYDGLMGIREGKKG